MVCTIPLQSSSFSYGQVKPPHRLVESVEARVLHLIGRGIEKLRRDVADTIRGERPLFIRFGKYTVQHEDHADASGIRGQDAMGSTII